MSSLKIAQKSVSPSMKALSSPSLALKDPASGIKVLASLSPADRAAHLGSLEAARPAAPSAGRALSLARLAHLSLDIHDALKGIPLDGLKSGDRSRLLPHAPAIGRYLGTLQSGLAAAMRQPEGSPENPGVVLREHLLAARSAGVLAAQHEKVILENLGMAMAIASGLSSKSGKNPMADTIVEAMGERLVSERDALKSMSSVRLAALGDDRDLSILAEHRSAIFARLSAGDRTVLSLSLTGDALTTTWGVSDAAAKRGLALNGPAVTWSQHDDIRAAEIAAYVQLRTELQYAYRAAFGEKDGAKADLWKSGMAWLAPRLSDGRVRFSEIHEAAGVLAAFEKHKGRIEQPDILKYANYRELLAAVDPHLGNAASRKEERRLDHARMSAEPMARVVFNGDGLKIVQPLCVEASAYWGRGTKWCTATTSEETKNEFYRYHGPAYRPEDGLSRNENRGPLYVVMLEDGRKYQIHGPTQQLMNELNNPVEIDEAREILREMVERSRSEEILDAALAVDPGIVTGMDQIEPWMMDTWARLRPVQFLSAMEGERRAFDGPPVAQISHSKLYDRLSDEGQRAFHDVGAGKVLRAVRTAQARIYPAVTLKSDVYADMQKRQTEELRRQGKPGKVSFQYVYDAAASGVGKAARDYDGRVQLLEKRGTPAERRDEIMLAVNPREALARMDLSEMSLEEKVTLTRKTGIEGLLAFGEKQSDGRYTADPAITLAAMERDAHRLFDHIHHTSLTKEIIFVGLDCPGAPPVPLLPSDPGYDPEFDDVLDEDEPEPDWSNFDTIVTAAVNDDHELAVRCILERRDFGYLPSDLSEKNIRRIHARHGMDSALQYMDLPQELVQDLSGASALAEDVEDLEDE